MAGAKNGSAPQWPLSSKESNGMKGDDRSSRHNRVRAIARSYSRSVDAGQGQQACLGEPNSSLDPGSSKFDSFQWAKALCALYRQNGTIMRTAGVCFQNLTVYGFGGETDYQKNVANVLLSVGSLVRRLTGLKRTRTDILRSLDGLVQAGEMLVVLGPPGSGCSTLLKAIAGEMNGTHVDEDSYWSYQGIRASEMHSSHRGEVIYNAEIDIHFPHLTAGDTLMFAARARQPRRLDGCEKLDFATHLRDVVMAMFGISHTVDTRVGDDFVRGVSGGERKRVSIAEAALSQAPLQCWDNSTRGLDSANAIEFCKTLRLQSDMFGSTACVSMYQAPQKAFEVFDKVTVLYEGRQIYFGPVEDAKEYFINLGFDCPPRQTTPDFLTSMTSPSERTVRRSHRNRAPRTADEFQAVWKSSAEYEALQAEIADYRETYGAQGQDAQAFRDSKKAQQAKRQREKSPYILSYAQQVRLCLWRGWRRLISDPSLFVGSLFGNFATALIVGSIFFNLDNGTSTIFKRGSLLFTACLMNALVSVQEILTLYAQRPIVEKHKRYALYHASAEAIASLICGLPYKVANTLAFNLTLYFMTNLRRDVGAVFFYLLIIFFTTLVMSMIFRTIASASRSIFQSLIPTSLLLFGLVIFSGFILPEKYMLGWCKWISYVNPLAYAFEALMVNEFHGREFSCSQYVLSAAPPVPTLAGAFAKYADVGAKSRICNAVGAVSGREVVDGDAHLRVSYGYQWEDRWGDFGKVCAFTVFFLALYLVASEFVTEKKSKGEVLVFPRRRQPASVKPLDLESHPTNLSTASTAASSASGTAGGSDTTRSGSILQKQTSVFHWQDLCYDIKTKGERRRILDRIDGWVKPGTLTALMGVSGAGKTALLDCLADRVTAGVITGDAFVDGKPRDVSFQRKTGYVLQQDIHLQTSTVREALSFSALLRQPGNVSREEKLAYVDEVIQLLEMEDYADAVVGVPGEGLNIEQRKRLTIGVELAAKPPLLLFVDEPTSGLDSQTSWAILNLLEKLTQAGQAIVCTIHQPSAMLFQRFDRLLFLAKGGKTVYFGDIGENSKTMTDYLEKNGAKACPEDTNPAEWMLEAIGATPGSSTDIDWPEVWRSSSEYRDVQAELEHLKYSHGKSEGNSDEPETEGEFASPFFTQLRESLSRVFQQYWRSPVYIFSKMGLCTLDALFVGFIFFDAPNTIQGLQNQMFATFLLLTVFSHIIQQYMPQFIMQRTLYEARERPSNVYSWRVFLLSQFIVELPWNILIAAIMYSCWYYPIGLFRNAQPTGQEAERSILMFLFILNFLLFTSTFAILVISAFDTAEAGVNFAGLLYTLCLIFCGVLTSPSSLPAFWKFMYRASPLTYLISGVLATGLANIDIDCADDELLRLEPPVNQTCGQYLFPYDKSSGGSVRNPSAKENCLYCPTETSNTFLASVNSYYADRWRNYGILWAFIIFNVFAAMLVYWVARVPKKKFGIKK